jgi:uncharacterized protein YbjT (DUF2867 family)
MKVVVIGGTGLIGSTIVQLLNAHGHDVRPASLQTGTNIVTGMGVDDAVAGAEVLVDVSNSPSFADKDVMAFFFASTVNLLGAAKSAGVGHYVALSVVGCDRLPDSGYLRAKVAQEDLITSSDLPYTIVRATQFFEFVKGIADAATEDDKVRLPTAFFQPMAAKEVAAATCRAAVAAPVNGVQEIGGPERVRMADFVSGALERAGDARAVVADPHAKYFGTELGENSLVPGPNGWTSSVTFRDWFAARQS